MPNYLEMPYSSSLDFGTGDFCIMGWIKTSSVGTEYVLMRRDVAGAGEGPQLYLSNGNAIFGATTGGVITSPDDVNSGTWRFVAGTRVGGSLSLYVDGVLVETGSNTADLDNTSAILRVGVNNAAGGAFSGSLALLRIGSTAPSAARIKAIYEQELPKFQTNAGAPAFINGAVDGTALTENDTPILLPDLSQTDMDIGYDFMGHVSHLALYSADVTDDGLEEVTI